MLDTRLKVLEDAEIISLETGNYVRKVIEQLHNYISIDEKQSVSEMLVTHLAMATQRMLNQEGIESLDDIIWQEVVNDEAYERAVELYASIMIDAPCTFPEGEKRFLVMHLCNLIK